MWSGAWTSCQNETPRQADRRERRRARRCRSSRSGSRRSRPTCAVTLRLAQHGGRASRCRTRPSRRPSSRLEAHAMRGRQQPRSRKPSRPGRPRPSRSCEAALARIAERDKALNAFTAVTRERALAKARAIDADRAAGTRAGAARRRAVRGQEPVRRRRPATLAGSKINRDRPPATADATLIERLEAAGAVLVGALNMGEYAYDFTGENVHDGPSRNPHDTEPHDRRLLGRLRRRGGRRPGADRARLRHQRLDPRAVLVLRPVRPQADLRPPVARRAPSRSWRASTIWGRWRAPRATWRSPTMPCRATTPRTPCAPTRPVEPALPLHRARR